MNDRTTLGQTVYDAWAAARRASGAHVHLWDELDSSEQSSWHAAALASRDRVFEDMRERFIAGLYRVFGERV